MWLCWHGNSSGKRYVCIEFFFSSPQFQVFHSKDSLTTFPPPTCTQRSEGAFFISLFFGGGGCDKASMFRPCSFKRMRVLYTSLESSDLLKYALLLFQKGAEESTFPLFQILQIKCKYKNTSIRPECIFLLQLCPLVVDQGSTRLVLSLIEDIFCPVGYCHLVVGNIYDNKPKIKRQVRVTSCHIYFYCKVNVISKT